MEKICGDCGHVNLPAEHERERQTVGGCFCPCHWWNVTLNDVTNVPAPELVEEQSKRRK